MASTEGIVKCFSVKAPFDYQGTPCSVLADKGTELRWGSLFHSEKPRELKEHVFCFALGFFPSPVSLTCCITYCLSVWLDSKISDLVVVRIIFSKRTKKELIINEFRSISFLARKLKRKQDEPEHFASRHCNSKRSSLKGDLVCSKLQYFSVLFGFTKGDVSYLCDISTLFCIMK